VVPRPQPQFTHDPPASPNGSNGGAHELAEFARSLTDAEWRMTTPGDGRPVGVIVHHVATVYPLEVHLAQLMPLALPSSM